MPDFLENGDYVAVVLRISEESYVKILGMNRDFSELHIAWKSMVDSCGNFGNSYLKTEFLPKTREKGFAAEQ